MDPADACSDSRRADREIYGDAVHARTRTPLTVTFGDVQELVSTVNVTELADMAGDQIVFARLNETRDVLDLSVYLPGGHIRIVAGRYDVRSAKSKR